MTILTELPRRARSKKIYLNNTNLAYATSESTPDVGNLRETVFLSLIAQVQPVTSSSAGSD